MLPPAASPISLLFSSHEVEYCIREFDDRPGLGQQPIISPHPWLRATPDPSGESSGDPQFMEHN